MIIMCLAKYSPTFRYAKVHFNHKSINILATKCCFYLLGLRCDKFELEKDVTGHAWIIELEELEKVLYHFVSAL